jgi:hypothetical protein
MRAQAARRRVTMLLPWFSAKYLFKPRVGPLRKDRILDRIAFWRSLVAIVVVMIVTYRFQGAMGALAVLGENFSKAMQTATAALFLLPVSFLVMLIVTRSGRRTQLLRGAARLLGRATLALAVIFFPLIVSIALPSEVSYTNPDPGAAILVIVLVVFLAIPLVIFGFFWFWCLWGCTIYWAARTGFWTGEMNPLLAPIGTAFLLLLLNGYGIIAGDAPMIPHVLWLTLNICGTATSLVLSILEYRHLRSNGYRFRGGPQTLVASEPSPVSPPPALAASTSHVQLHGTRSEHEMQRFTTDAQDMAAQVTWLVSGWDLKAHAFRTFGEVASEAVCRHSAMTSRLVESTGDEAKCYGCLLIVGVAPGQHTDLVSKPSFNIRKPIFIVMAIASVGLTALVPTWVLFLALALITVLSIQVRDRRRASPHPNPRHRRHHLHPPHRPVPLSNKAPPTRTNQRPARNPD